MSIDKIKHLYARAGFGLSPQEYNSQQTWSIDRAVDHLFDEASKVKKLPKVDLIPLNRQTMTREEIGEVMKKEREVVKEVVVGWLLRMTDSSESALVEKMALFWHGHFACEGRVGKMAQNQLSIFRKHGLGNFKDLVNAMAKDAAMIRYLNNQQNKKNKPNENFARELMELFTIGIGNYTEQDVKEAARAFTGWSSNEKGKYIFKKRQHDFDQKTFMGQTGDFNGEDIIGIILERKETAIFITDKIYRYFVNEIVDDQVIKELAEDFYKSEYDIGRLMRTIFTSDWFYDSKNIGTKIKSPTEFIAGLLRQLEGTPEKPRALLNVLKALGQNLFSPPNVAGWPGGKNWIDNSTLILRLNIPYGIFNASDMAFSVKPELEEMGKKNIKKLSVKIEFLSIMEMVEGLDQAESWSALESFFLHVPIAIQHENLENFIFGKSKRKKYLQQLCLRLMSLPEYQLC